MRISGAGLARIRYGEQYVLLLNRGQLRHGGRRIVSPIGGAFELDGRGLQTLKRIGATDFEQGKDLRCRVPDNKLPSVIRWFTGCNGRETSVMRELREELVDESQVLTERDLRGATQQFVRFVRHDDVTTRNVPERQTAYLFDIFEVTLPAAAMRKLAVASRAPIETRWIYLVTAEETLAGTTLDGTRIASFSQHIL